MKDTTLDEIINRIVDMRDDYNALYISLAQLGIEDTKFYGTVEGLELARRIIIEVTNGDTETTLN